MTTSMNSECWSVCAGRQDGHPVRRSFVPPASWPRRSGRQGLLSNPSCRINASAVSSGALQVKPTDTVPSVHDPGTNVKQFRLALTCVQMALPPKTILRCRPSSWHDNAPWSMCCCYEIPFLMSTVVCVRVLTTSSSADCMSAARSTSGFRTQPVLQGETLWRNLSDSGYSATDAAGSSSGGCRTAVESDSGSGNGSGGILREGLLRQDGGVDIARQQPQGIENLGNTCYMNATLQVRSPDSRIDLFIISFSAD